MEVTGASAQKDTPIMAMRGLHAPVSVCINFIYYVFYRHTCTDTFDLCPLEVDCETFDARSVASQVKHWLFFIAVLFNFATRCTISVGKKGKQ